jgi:hypothetical protein
MHEKTREETGRNRPGLRESGRRQATAGPGSVGAREAVKRRSGSTLAITERMAKRDESGRGASSSGLVLVFNRETLSWVLVCLLCRPVPRSRRVTWGTRPAEAAGRCITVWPEQNPAAHLLPSSAAEYRDAKL